MKKTGKGLERGLTFEDLKGKQSVRATFRLPQQVIDLLSVLAGQLGIKQKSLFDQLVENADILNDVAEKAHPGIRETGQRRQKTFVISRRSLKVLERIAKKRKVPRDLLVELSINRLLPVIEVELGKHENRKILLKDLENHLARDRKLLAKAGDLLDGNDPVYRMIEGQVKSAEKNLSAALDLIEKGKPMEDW